MGNCSLSADDNGFDIKAELSVEQLLFIQSQRKKMKRVEKDTLDKAIQQHVLMNIVSSANDKQHVPPNSLEVSDAE